jgi:four helix bundle protein
MKESIIQEKTFAFALKIIVAYKEMVSQNEFVISKQRLKCGTSIGANTEEALAGVSKNDFANKFAIASKEARETKYWLRLIKFSKIVNLPNIDSLISDSDEIIRIITAIVKTSQKNIKASKTKLTTKN